MAAISFVTQALGGNVIKLLISVLRTLFPYFHKTQNENNKGENMEELVTIRNYVFVQHLQIEKEKKTAVLPMKIA